MDKFKLIHSPSYKWIIVFAGALGLFASLGLGRFSLGMMLPAMGEELSLSYSQMGVIGTVNFCGYLGAVLLCGLLTAKFGPRLLICCALLLVCLSMVLVSFTDNYVLIVLLYFLTGVGSALANVPIMALVSSWFDGKSRGRAAGFCVMGNGMGILVSGKAVPFLNQFPLGWRMSWIVLGGVVGCVAFFCYILLREKPIGSQEKQDQSNSEKLSIENEKSMGKPGGSLIFYHCGLLYFLFGFTYVIYVTFFVTTLVDERHLSELVAGQLWSWVGFLAIISGPLFGYVSDRWGRKMGLMIVFSMQMASYFLFAADLPLFAVYLSLCCFGIVAFSVPSIISALVADHAGPQRTAAVFGFVTFLFGIGQIAGPACAGFIAEYTGSFSNSYLLAAMLAGAAVVLSALLPAGSSR